VTVDEGRFTITRAGQPIGREEFSIRRTPSNDTSVVYVASGTATYGERRVTTALRTSPSGAPIAYEADVRVGGASVQRVRGQFAHGRFGSISRTAGGETSREDMLDGATVIVDDELFHQYYFLALDHSRTAAVLLVPRRGARLPARLERIGADSIDVAGRAVSTTRYRVRGPGDSTRELWLDDRGRVIKVSLADGVLAVRDEPPR
jgi:hypothetical protein